MTYLRLHFSWYRWSWFSLTLNSLTRASRLALRKFWCVSYRKSWLFSSSCRLRSWRQEEYSSSSLSWREENHVVTMSSKPEGGPSHLTSVKEARGRSCANWDYPRKSRAHFNQRQNWQVLIALEASGLKKPLFTIKEGFIGKHWNNKCIAH